jgi:hypothetical protein
MNARHFVTILWGWVLFASSLPAAQYTCDRQIPGPYFGGTVLAMNEAGGVLGFGEDRSPSGTVTRWFLLYPDSRDVGPSPLVGGADVNNNGEVVGSYVNDAGTRVNYLRTADGSSSRTIDPPLGAEQERFVVSGMNDDDYITGILGEGAGTRVFVRSPNGEFHFHAVPYATDRVRINQARQLIINQAVPHQTTRAFLLNEDGTQQEVAFPGVVSTEVLGLNDSGAVVGSAIYNQATSGAFGFVRSTTGTYSPVTCSMYNGSAAEDIANSGQILTNATPTFGIVGTVFTPTGEPSTPTLQLSFTSWQFAGHPVGTASGLGRIYVTNSGTERRFLRTDLSYFDANGSPDFAVQSNCLSLDPGQTCSLSFTFTPTRVGDRKTRYYLINDDGQPLRTIALRGTGEGQSLQLSRTD